MTNQGKTINRKKLLFVAIPIWLFVIFLFIFLIKIINGGNSNKIDNKGKDINGIYKLYQNQIYALVPSDGYMPVQNANTQTFRGLVDNSYQDAHIGIDKNNVYAGNIILPELNPLKTKAIGNNYYSDGNTTYYCGRNSIQNPKLNDWQEIWQTFKYEMFNGKRPQIYLYPIVKLPKSDTEYHSILDLFVASNGQKTYYKGLLMPDANAENLKQVNILYEDGDIRKSYIYLKDENNVYFENYKLNIQSNNHLYSFYVENLSQQQYLFDPISGFVFIENIEFPKVNTPYKVISHYGNHVYQVLFLSEKGIYYFDSEKKIVKRAGDNIFLNTNFKEIAPLVFSDGLQILFLDGSESWGNSRTDKSLQSRTTYIYKLDEDIKGIWKKTGNTYKGSVWKNNNQYYYFDELGHSQLIHHTIYKIQNKEIAEKLVNNKILPRELWNLIRDDELIEVKKIKMLEAKTRY